MPFLSGKACLNSCRFGAISPGDNHMKIDPAKCKECGMCANACPYGAIIHVERPCKKACPMDAISYNEFGIAHIDEEKCVNCGHCIHNCPFGAIGSKVYLVDIINEIKAGKEVIAMVAPSIEGQFGDANLASIRQALKKMGFADMVEVGLGADLTAAYEAREWIEAIKEGNKLTTSCCPAFVEMIRKNYPDIYEKNKSKTVSPMC
ncbi:MAG: 4Fe-4S binding protein, partial [Erysipelotrichaceae bacterium]|nr:4Fe-4S binding protein [Erysipelotrichaceae bacterium]